MKVDEAPLHLACAADARYLPHVATLIESIAASNPQKGITLHLMHDRSVTAALQDQLRTACDQLGIALNCIEPGPELTDELPPSGTYPSMIWYRILLPGLLSSLDRILYLDGDTLVLQDLQSLWRTDLGDRLLAAVAHPSNAQTARHNKHIGLPGDSAYFNSGVLLLNLEKMRAVGFSRRMIEVGKNRAKEVVFPDQDTFNLACDGQWLRLHPKWNCLSGFFLSFRNEDSLSQDNLQIAEAVASPAILHFEGTNFVKPWHYRSVHPRRHLYLAYRQRTPWPLPELEGSRALRSSILKYFPLRLQVFLVQLKRSITSKKKMPSTK